MFKSEILSHLIISIIYFFLIGVLRFKIDLSLVLILLGILAGTYVLDIDHLIYWFLTNPDKDDSKEAKSIWERRGIGGIREMGEILEKHHKTHTNLIFHTAFFQIVLLGIGSFLILSENNPFGLAFILSINLHLLKDEWFDYFKRGRDSLGNWLFWQYPKFDYVKYQKLYLIIVTGFFIFLTYNFLNG